MLRQMALHTWYVAPRGIRAPDSRLNDRVDWLPQGCRAAPDFARFPPAIGSASVSHYGLTKPREVGHHPTTLGELLP
jgi:hypothetical protein